MDPGAIAISLVASPDCTAGVGLADPRRRAVAGKILAQAGRAIQPYRTAARADTAVLGPILRPDTNQTRGGRLAMPLGREATRRQDDAPLRKPAIHGYSNSILLSSNHSARDEPGRPRQLERSRTPSPRAPSLYIAAVSGAV